MAKRRHWPVIRFPADEEEERARADAVARLKNHLARSGPGGAASTELREAWDAFFAVYLPLIREVVRRHGCKPASVDEYVQAICAWMFEKQTPRRHEPERATFDYWLSLVIHRHYVNLAIAERRRKKVEQPLAADTPNFGILSVVASVELIELRDGLTTAWETTRSELSPKHARIIELRYGSGLSVREVSDVVKVAPKTVKSCCYRVARAFFMHAGRDPALASLLDRRSLSPPTVFQNFCKRPADGAPAKAQAARIDGSGKTRSGSSRFWRQ